MEKYSEHSSENSKELSDERVNIQKKLTYSEPKKLFWGAIFAGVVIALVSQLLISLLGLGIGFGLVDLQESSPTGGLGVGTGIWWIVGSIVSLFIAGWTAARLAGVKRPIEGAMHGVMAWAFVTLVSVLLMGTALGGIFSGAFGLVGNTVSVAGETFSESIPEFFSRLGARENAIISMKNEAMKFLRQTDKPALEPQTIESELDNTLENAEQTAESVMAAPGNADAELESFFDNLSNTAEGILDAVDKEALANIIVARTNKSKAEAISIVDGWEKQFQRTFERANRTKEQVTSTLIEVGDDALAGLSAVSLWAFFALLLGGAAAAIGGRVGFQRRSIQAVRV